jgi:hypothetical protein
MDSGLLHTASRLQVATSNAKTETQGDISPEEMKRMQAMLGAAKSKDSKVFSNLVGENA